MRPAPRATGLPLDAEAAAQRAAQAAVLADPVRLRVLSAALAAGEADILGVCESTGLTPAEVADAVAVLRGAALVAPGEPTSVRPTADAWMRFGRLLVAPVPSTGELGPPPADAMTLPPVAERIARDLSYRFSATFSPETVARYVAESYALLAERASVRGHLPSLTAKFAADRLGALATAKGLVLRGTPEVLFVCVRNAARSQMAAAILRHLVGDRVHVRTAGSAPASMVHPDVIEVLDEIGVPIAAEFPKPLTDEVVQAADVVVTMGCGDACPVYPGRRYLDWDLDDPVGRPRSEMARIRDEIVDRVTDLARSLDVLDVTR